MKVTIVLISLFAAINCLPLNDELPNFCDYNGKSLVCNMKGINQGFDFGLLKRLFPPVDYEERHELDLFALEWSQIEYLPADAFKLGVNFKTIRIASSNLKTIDPDAFGENLSVEKVELYNNQLVDGDDNVSVFEAFRGLINLVELNLSGNQLTKVPTGALKGRFNEKKNKLVEIVLVSNEITEIEDFAFSDAPNMEKIYLDYNQLEKIGRNAFKFDQEREYLEIRMSYNQIETIESGAFNGINRKITLDFEENRLTRLPADVFNLPNIIFMDLYGNPFNCDCHLSWLKGRKNDDLYQFGICQTGQTVVEYADKNC